MELFAIIAVALIPVGYVIESFTYSYQKGNAWGASAKLFAALYNVLAVGTVFHLQWMVDTTGIENFSDLESISFYIENLICISVFGTDGMILGYYLRAQQRYLNNESVPPHLLKTAEDKKREQEILKAKKEKELERMEREAGLREAPTVEPEPEPEPFDHEAELEDILKSKK